MNFASPLWLLAAGLVVLVLLLHTLRQTQQVVPSLYLWRQVTVDQRPRRSLRPPMPNLLLILQVLAVLGLAAALAAPFFGSSAPTHTVLVIDRSASMGTAPDGETTRLDLALDAASAVLAAAGQGSDPRISVIETGAGTRYLAALQQPSEALADSVADLSVTAGTPDWPEVAARLPGLVDGAADLRVVVFTDDPEAARMALAAVVDPAQLSVWSPGEAADGVTNIGVTALARPLEGGEASAWELTGTVTGDVTEEAPALGLRYRPLDSNTELDWVPPALVRPPSGAATPAENAAAPYRFTTNLALPGPGVVTLQLPPDAAAFDNTYRLVLDNPLGFAEVLYVGPGNRNLELALLSTGLVDLYRGQSLPADVDRYDLVVIENLVVTERPDTNVLWLGSARLEGAEAPTVSAADLTRWDADHPLARSVDWRTVAGVQAYVFPELETARTVLWAGTDPLLTARTLPEGRDIRLAMDVSAEEWTERSVLPALVVNIVNWLDTGVTEPARACIAGVACDFPARFAGAAITAEDGTVLRDAVTTADDAAVSDTANGFVPQQPGIYTVGTGAEAFLVAVNATPILSGLPYTASVEGDAGIAQSAAGLPLWAWLAMLVAALLLVEAVLALRRREGFARTGQLSGDAAAVRRKRVALGLRTLAVLLILVAILTPPFLALAPSTHRVLVADATAPDAENALASACSGFGPGGVGAVSLSGVPQVLRAGDCTPVASAAEPTAGEGASTTRALELAAAVIPAGTDGEIVLAATAAASATPLEAAVDPLQARGLALELVTAENPPQSAAWASALDVPPTLREGDAAAMTAIIGAAAAGEVEVAFGVGDEEISRSTLALQAGATRVDTRLPPLEPGETEFWVEVAAAGADQPANGRVSVLRNVLAIPTIGVISPEEDWGQQFADALEVQGLQAVVVAPNRAPFWMHDWLSRYDGVALMNVPAIDLDTRQQEQLDEYVRVHGRGLMILGGENTFGPGGYFQTPLEAMSPLSSRVPQEAPVAALAFVLDRSGSMQAEVQGVSRLDIAKQATITAVELLNPESQVAVIVFDEFANVIVPLQEQKDEAEIQAALDALDPGGGTSIGPGLEEALAQLEGADAPIKHIIVMSDGLTQPADFETLMARAAELEITVSTVSIGDGADVGRLADLARIGGGSSHVTSDFRALPSILSQEAMMLGGESMEYGTFPVSWLDRDAPYLANLPDLPPLDGYVLTSEKPEATLHLATVDDEGERVPLLASWRYGNGSVLALATHAVGPGSEAWQNLPQFPQLYGQAMRHFLADAPSPGLQLDVRRAGDALVVEADILDREGQPLSNLVPTAQVIAADGTVVADLALQPDSPGVYLGQTGPLQPGRYTIAATGGIEPDTNDELVGETAVILGYPAALDPFRAAPEQLAALAAQTGGTARADLSALGGGLPRLDIAPAWRPFLVLGLILFLIDLALRYAPGLFAMRGRRTPPQRPGLRSEAAPEPLPRAA